MFVWQKKCDCSLVAGLSVHLNIICLAFFIVIYSSFDWSMGPTSKPTVWTWPYLQHLRILICPQYWSRNMLFDQFVWPSICWKVFLMNKSRQQPCLLNVLWLWYHFWCRLFVQQYICLGILKQAVNRKETTNHLWIKIMVSYVEQMRQRQKSLINNCQSNWRDSQIWPLLPTCWNFVPRVQLESNR